MNSNFVWTDYRFPVSDRASRLINLPRSFIEVSYAAINDQRLANSFFNFIKEFDNIKTRDFFLHGDMKKGKTALACCMMKQLVCAKRGWPFYMPFPELLSHKINPIPLIAGDPETYWDHCHEADLLFLDDIGFEDFAPSTASALLLRILKARMDSGRSTFCLSQMGLEELKKKYGDAFAKNVSARMELVHLN